MRKRIINSITMMLIAIITCNVQATFANDEAIAPDSAGLYLKAIVATAPDGKEEWKYTTTEPASSWKDKDFDDSSWSKNYPSFGNTGTWKRTSWTTSDIWMRKTFSLEGMSESVLDSLVLKAAHDDGCEIYINGVLAAENESYSTNYKEYIISETARKSLLFEGENTIAVHCHNNGGSQHVDVGLYKISPCSYYTLITNAGIKPATWKYVTEAPDSLTWMTPAFDDTAWTEGNGGFGKSRRTHVISTIWDTDDLWLRKDLNFKGLKKEDLQSLTLTVIRDGICDIYINGILVAALEKNGIKNETIEIPAAALEAINLDGKTTIAVHVNRSNSLRYFDASLSCKAYRFPEKMTWKMKERPMMSVFANDVDPENVLGEYPRPQMTRAEWQNLNGVWDFQPLFKEVEGMPADAYQLKILVPFPVESAISGIMKGYTRFAYKRTFTVPENWKEKNLLIHFEAVDFECEVFVNGKSVGSHKGGYDPFCFDVTEALKAEGEQELVVKVYDPTDLGGQPRGKQTLSPGGIMYTCTSGIWQSVWMEPVEPTHIDNYTVVPDVDNSSVKIKTVTNNGNVEAKAFIEILDGGNVVATAETTAGQNISISVPDAKLWSPDSPFLYDLNITLVEEGDTLDNVKGYFGMRKISLGKDGEYTRMFLNNEPLFHIGPLDQGFWPDGIYTAPTDAALLYDIQATKDMGFNMIRKHIKIEPRRWYYHCDRLGMLVWQDMPSGASYGGVGIDQTQFKKELTAMIEKHYNSPSIIMWIIFNESQGRHNVDALVKYVKNMDPSRLTNQDSQYGVHSTYIGDVWDVHHYPNPTFVPCKNKNMANVCGEYGGLKYKEEGHVWGSGDWGYATMNSRKELINTYEKYVFDLIKLRDCFGLGGAVYTQTTDVEIEINGLITYDRAVEKVDFSQMKEINSRVIKSKLKKDTIIAIAMDGGEKWRMTTTEPATNWYAKDFDDSGWSEKKSGFGTSGTPNAVVGTTWNTENIWIRKTFRLDGLNRELADSLVMLMTHDEDCEIYVNGIQMAKFTGHDNNYSIVEFTNSVKNRLVYDGDNVVAVHCKQTTGGQFIDLGIYLLSQEGIPTSISGVKDEGKPYIYINKEKREVSITGGGFGDGTRLEVVNTSGTIVKTAVAGNTTISLATLPKGAYILRFASGNKKHTCKAIL